jgi:parvulin-like peptidyl-prolyl isomerase
MKPLVIVLIMAAVASADTPSAAPPAPTRPPTGSTAKLDHRVATVDRTPIWQSELDEAFAHAGLKTPTKEQIGLALDSLIDSILVDHAAEALHLEVTDPEIDMAIAEIKKQNNIDDAGLDKALADQHFTREMYRVELGRQVRAQKLFQIELVPHVAVTDDDVNKAYAKAKAANAGIESLDKIRDTIKQMVWGEKLAAEQELWIKRKRATAHIVRKP